MALTTLDLNTALIVIDLQNGLKGFPTVHPFVDVVTKTQELLEAFRKYHLPVVLVNVTGGAPGRNEQPPRTAQPPADWADLIPELNQQPEDITVTKKTWGAFTNTDLEEQLKTRGVTQVVIVGVATSIGVESTARFAYELGFNVTFALDAMTDLSLEAHDNSISRIFPRMGETGTAQKIIDLLNSTRG